MSPSAQDPVQLAEAVASRALVVPGVSELHPGMFGEVATYLPGRRLQGVRMDPDHVDVHVVIEWGRDVREVAAAVQLAIADVAPGRRVSVTVEDVAAPPAPGSGDAHG